MNGTADTDTPLIAMADGRHLHPDTVAALIDDAQISKGANQADDTGMRYLRPPVPDDVIDLIMQRLGDDDLYLPAGGGYEVHETSDPYELELVPYEGHGYARYRARIHVEIRPVDQEIGSTR